jgi:L-alanine-DL-glutamate epimerase-like enolase superfamily enzyme
MRITEVKILSISIPRLKELKVAYATRTVYRGVLLLLETDAGLCGLGEAAPNLEVCGETPEGAAAALAEMAVHLRGHDPLRREELLAALEPWRRNQAAALTAVDMALWDLAGKAAGLPLCSLLGGFRTAIGNAMTIGILSLEATVTEARAIQAGGRFREIKLKLGLDPDLDVARVRAVRAALGPDFPLHLDANQGYDPEGALAVLRALEPERIDFVEQPTPAQDLEALAWVSRRSPIPVMADESLHSPEDALRLARAEACTMLNVKLQKVGGITRALEVLAIARTAGMPCLVGCMTETPVGITAGAHLALASPAVSHVDLDGHLDLAFHPTRGGVQEQGDELTLPADPGATGLGLELEATIRDQFMRVS